MRGALYIVALIGLASARAEMPTVQQVSTRLAETRARTASELRGYSVVRRYTLTTGRHSAEMTVRLNYTWPGQKKFEILSQSGSNTIQKRVFNRLLKAEQDETRHHARINAQNYDLRPDGEETVDGRRCYILKLVPRGNNKYLIRGRAWVDSQDFALVKVEGEPVDDGSFWITGTHIVQRYRKVDGYWMPGTSESESDVRLFGKAHLRIENLDYKFQRVQTSDEARLLSRPQVE